MSTVHVIQLGLPWNYSMFDENAQKFVREALAKGKEKMASAGYNYREFDVTPETGMDPLIAYYKENKVDGVVIGAGIRRTVELGEFMENLVETTRVYAPQSKIMFNTSPDGALEATKRWFPSPNK